jgi:PqqD family protein of HPr-rel-A system
MAADSSPASAFWSSVPSDCTWACYGDDFVVFHRPSGKTHLLNRAGYRLLTDILQRPATSSEIAARLANSSGDGADTPDEVAVRDMLLRFEYLGLVYRSRPTA